jgi:hypothetical protein
MSKGLPLEHCKTCGSEIIEHVNDGVFSGGECDSCEWRRYETQPELLEYLKAYIDLDFHSRPTERLRLEARDALAGAEGKTPSTEVEG